MMPGNLLYTIPKCDSKHKPQRVINPECWSPLEAKSATLMTPPRGVIPYRLPKCEMRPKDKHQHVTDTIERDVVVKHQKDIAEE